MVTVISHKFTYIPLYNLVLLIVYIAISMELRMDSDLVFYSVLVALPWKPSVISNILGGKIIKHYEKILYKYNKNQKYSVVVRCAKYLKLKEDFLLIAQKYIKIGRKLFKYCI